MIFVDYYVILEIPFDAVHEDIKKAYHKLSLKHHPDKNKENLGATRRQQEINEAYYILGDTQKRKSYDEEYLRFQEYLKNAQAERTTTDKGQNAGGNRKQKENNSHRENEKTYADYKIRDDKLRDWMSEAKNEAAKVAQQAVSDIKGLVKEGANAAIQGIKVALIWIVVINIVYFVFKLLI